jgi:integrase
MHVYRLTERKIERLRSAGKAGRFADGGNLYLKITPPFGASWTLRYAIPGQGEKFLGLGSADTLSLEQARQRAWQARSERLAGTDPRGATLQTYRGEIAGSAVTFEVAFKTFWTGDGATVGFQSQIGSAKARTNWRGKIEKYVLPTLGKTPIDQITREHVSAIIGPLWRDKTPSARKLLGQLERIFDWAKVKKLVQGENPADRKAFKVLLPSAKNIHQVEAHPALPHEVLPAFVAELRGLSGPIARALEFVILTACRAGDVMGQAGTDSKPALRWQDLDLERGQWTIPSSKTGLPHVVPLSARALAIVEEMRGLDAEKVFPIRRDDMQKALTKLRPGTHVHGFRACFRTWAHRRTSFDRQVVEEIMAHKLVGDAVELRYIREGAFEKRKEVLDGWATFADGNVIALRRSA